MRVLIFNSGSSSLKFKLMDMPSEIEVFGGIVENIGEPEECRLVMRPSSSSPEGKSVDCMDHGQALDIILKEIDVQGACSVRGREKIDLLGHRLVHGKDIFKTPALVNERVLKDIDALKELAPLHMPPAISVLKKCRERLPDTPQVVCFDTTFFQSMPERSYRYAVPRRWQQDHGVRRYGFHGLSHQYVSQRVSEQMGINLSSLKLISAHLGNGASITAFDRGGVLDTSMGFTPLEGLIMGTRSGDIDPAVLPYLKDRTGMDCRAILDILNTGSGLMAVGGCGRDLRSIMNERKKGNSDAALAVDMYVHRLRKYIGAYFFALSGAQAFVFTGGVGENSWELREMIISGWDSLGFVLDKEANRIAVNGRSGMISTETSKVKIFVVRTDEERMIARLAFGLTGHDLK